MAIYYYAIMLGISILLTVVYAFIFHKHFDPNITIMVILIPIINLAFVFMALAKTPEEAIIPLKISYLGGCYVLLSTLFLIINTCGIKTKAWMKAVFFVISTAVYVTALTIGYSNIFYVGLPKIGEAYGASYLYDKHYGFMHTIFYVLVGVYYLIIVAAIVYSFFKKKQVPRSILILISIAVTIAMIGFFGARLITNKIELLPITYNVGMAIYIIIVSRLRLYNPSDSVIDSLVQKGDTGFISFDNKMRYLGSNETAKKMIPELNELMIDKPINGNPWFMENILPLLKEFESDEEKNKHFLERDGKTYSINVNRLVLTHLWHAHKGYQFLITDDTSNQQYIKLIKTYNSQLEEEVIKKTRSILDMQDKLVMGMARMVEGRDNSTGGHIKRTSDGVRILMGEIMKENELGLSEEFCKDIIKAAPMHDLGKITVDDQILRKPGRFTPEEFEAMKTHAAEGARIVGQILEGTEDKEFARIAVNVAHYHHERWDGSGYPCKLKGEEIPLEARIMAIADVYDALVSKRVYKEKMSFDEAHDIIMSGMGSQFDKSLEKYYLAARPALEEYYKHADS